MEGQDEARIIGMAMVRGLVSTDALKTAASAAPEDLLAALMARGVIDEIDVEVLESILEGQNGAPQRQASFNETTDPLLDSNSGSDFDKVWQELPETAASSNAEGKRVRESFTVSRWKGYQDLQFVAEGGLGRIFKAFDPRLKRAVALKFLRMDDPELQKRFVLEAQHQAKVEHPNICKVFDVGEWKGQAYIAMQFIHGETLESAALHMDLDEKVETVEIVAEALHAAHRQGLTHRDVKPANIMVERLEDMKPKPYVLDFGLARDLESSGLTIQGMVIGTVHYMAPEQAMGQFDRINRRTDVYGLGATLYKVLTGRMVFQGTDGLDSARRTIEEEPEPPRKWIPELPKDLETIVMKCLEKDPDRRYESALALAEDLRRFREGEPIQARPASWSYRAGKYTKKHRALVAFSATALVWILALACWGISLSFRARKVAALATTFSAEAENMATSLRMAYLLPRHDIRPDQANIRNRMTSVRQIIQQEGTIAEGSGAYALGQGHLALQEYAQARKDLETAWAKGYQNPQVALALGQTLGELYRQGWEQLTQISDLVQRESQKKELQREFRDPALFYLKAGETERPERRSYMEGLLAYYSEQYPAAIDKAKEAFGKDPTFYEAKMLEGNALVAMALAEQDNDPNSSRRHLQDAGAPYAIALNMARSDPALIAAEGRRQSEILRAAIYYTANDEINYEKVQATLDQVFTVDPSNASVYITKALLSEQYACFLGDHGNDPFPTLDQAIQWCEKAGRLSQDRLSTVSKLGLLYRMKSQFLFDRGLDSSEAYAKAMQSLDEALRLRPGDSWLHSEFALLYSQRADLALQRGEDPREFLDHGLVHARESLRLADSVLTIMSCANLHFILGDWLQDHGEDPEPSYQQALSYYQMMISKAPDDSNGYTGVEALAESYAAYLHRIGKPADQLIEQGIIAANKAVELQPNYLNLLNQMGIFRTQTQILIDRGEDPSVCIQLTKQAQQRCLLRNSKGDFYIHFDVARLEMLIGQAEMAKHRSPEPAWSEAKASLIHAMKMNSSAPEPPLYLARLAWMEAPLQSNPVPAITLGLDAIVRGFKVKPRQPELMALRGCLYMVQAETLADPRKRIQRLEGAKLDLETALSQNKFLSREFAPELEKIKAQLASGNG